MTLAGPSVYFDHLPKTDPNRLEVLRVIQSTWLMSLGSTKIGTPPSPIGKTSKPGTSFLRAATQSLHKTFLGLLGHLAGDYYRVTSALIKKYDPNHLILGVRYRGYAPPEVVQAPVASPMFNPSIITSVMPALDLDQFQMMYQAADQPVIVSEYSFHSLAAAAATEPCRLFSAGPGSTSRADGYRLMTTRLPHPYVLGADWFQWMDEPPSGRSSDGEDVNFGIVDIDDRPYEALVSAIGSTTPLLNPCTNAAPPIPSKMSGAKSFATKPVAHIPFLVQAPRINGELGDWPEQAKIRGIRHSQTVGLDRSSLPWPNVYVGWNNSGLFIGLEVFDNDIESAPAKRLVVDQRQRGTLALHPRGTRRPKTLMMPTASNSFSSPTIPPPPMA